MNEMSFRSILPTKKVQISNNGLTYAETTKIQLEITLDIELRFTRSPYNKLLLYKQILTPIWIYSNHLWEYFKQHQYNIVIPEQSTKEHC